ncbi:MAG: hypothetical protein N2Z79_01315, partial [Candidatus Omnitrophica bacterium]|nr:hypothetical protein [Candidatus Omnitrophota bacterium]
MLNKINPALLKQRIISKVQTDKKKISLFILICTAIIIFDYVFLLRPQLNSLRKSKQKIVELRNKIDSFQREWKDFEKQRNIPQKPRIVRRVILREEVSKFLEKLSDLAYKNNIKIIKISQEDSKDKPPAVLVNLELKAGYHNLGRFAADLENSEVIFEFGSLIINGNP